ncbi:phosphotransferase [Acerihabitans sp. KWT182]|uniref:Phosphotransferase n=1 Tax=Acerihabitans sp. KWT182 TaxID=3157919 RepID=A0AAU7Q7S1_9GAMM
MLYQDEFIHRLRVLLQAALPEWGLDAGSELSLLTVSENATWLAVDPLSQRRLVLRVHRPDYSSAEEIRSELAWIQALRAAGTVDTAAPVPRLDGGLVGHLPDQGTLRHVVAFEFVPGHEPSLSGGLKQRYAELGRINAALHNHSRRWRKPAGFVRKRWDFSTIIGERARWGDWRHAPGLAPEGMRILERAAALLKKQTDAYGQDPARFGLVHCDMRLANLLVDGPRMTVIDFDDCGGCWYMYDFAAAVSFIEEDPRIGEFLAAWLEGYRSVAPLGADDEAAIPMFLMLRRMQLTAWIASHGETSTAQSMGPDYTRGTVSLAERYLGLHLKG